MKYSIGTRGSRLAIAQANMVCNALKRAYPKDEFELRIVKTTGDLILDKPLHELGDKGVFVKEIEELLLSGEIQIGAHSMKDMPSEPACGLMFTKAWKREDPRDILALREKTSLMDLPKGAKIGTGSRRRAIQLLKLRPDLNIVGIRGNVETRLRKMEEEGLDGIALAAAGLHRLGLQDKITQYLETRQVIPAPAQGILALEIREGDEELLSMLDAFCDPDTVRAVEAERGFLQEIGGDCHLPVGAVFLPQKNGEDSLHVMFGRETGAAAYACVSGQNPEALAKQAACQIRQKLAGTVYLVGAGPGDPDLITVKGRLAIRNADCIIYDRLASEELLKEAKAGCELIYAGKEDRRHTMGQEEIQRLLVKKSMEYQAVVRLKGGDPFVFGRGGEEALYLKEHGVAFEVIPGISSSIAGPAAAGIPITHRGKSLGFHAVTAHDRKDALADIDFKAMAKGGETCVFLMGLSKIEEIAKRLLLEGMPKETPAAVISCATMPQQNVCVADLEHIAEKARRAKLASPAVIVVGETVSLHRELDMSGQRPLTGKRYLVPKIGSAPTRLKELLQKQGASVDEIQAGEIAYLDRNWDAETFREVDWLIFGSKHGVEAFFSGIQKSGVDIRSLFACKIAAVGAKTAGALRAHGIFADLVPKEFHSDALAEELRARLSGGERVCYLRAKEVDSQLKDALGGVCEFQEIAVYENRPVAAGHFKQISYADYDGAFFTCASLAKRLTAALGNNFGACKAYSIGPKTAACLKECGAPKPFEAEEASYESLAGLVIGTD